MLSKRIDRKVAVVLVFILIYTAQISSFPTCVKHFFHFAFSYLAGKVWEFNLFLFNDHLCCRQFKICSLCKFPQVSIPARHEWAFKQPRFSSDLILLYCSGCSGFVPGSRSFHGALMGTISDVVVRRAAVWRWRSTAGVRWETHTKHEEPLWTSVAFELMGERTPVVSTDPSFLLLACILFYLQPWHQRTEHSSSVRARSS